MLEALKDIHRQLLAQIDALEAVVRRPEPQREALASARWRLMRESRARLKLLGEAVYPALAAVLPRPIADFQADDAAKRATSATHIAHWEIDRITADWATYQKVSADMTMAMRRRVADEQAVLYPALQSLVSSSAASRS